MRERIRNWLVRHKHVGISAIAILLVVSIVLSMCHFIGGVESLMENAQAQQDDTASDPSGDAEENERPEDLTEEESQPEDLTEEDLYVPVNNILSDTNDTQQSSGNTRNEFTVTFYTQGGSSISPRTVQKGTPISSLPIPYREGYIFVSWCYDAACAIPVAKDDVVAQDLSLYAAYSKEAALEAVHNVTFASATDVDGASFTITVVTEDMSITAEQVQAAITAENLTDPAQKDIISVTGTAGTFTISGRDPHETAEGLVVDKGFAEGATFRITLNDARLTFKDQAATAREFNFTTYKDEVLNMSLNQDMIFLSVDQVSNITNDGKNVETLSIAVYQSDAQGNLGPADLTTGTFTYQGELNVGDVVCIYDGLDPNLRTLETPKELNGELGYVEITGKDGSSYSYKNASAEQVIFEPDLLPIPTAADLDTSDATVTVEDQYLDYSADVYANIELDSQTTVDVGDFIMFYTGTFGILEGSDAAALTGYGKITGVAAGDAGTTVITYTVVDWNEVQAAMDIYNKERASGTELLENVDTTELEAQIAQQAIDSGFAEEAAMYLASLALATDNFTTLSENMNLEDYKVTLTDGTPVSPEQLQLMDSSIQVEAKMDDGYPRVTIGVTPEKLSEIEGTDAANKGLCIKLEVSTTITISKKGSDNIIEIKVSGAFTEELGVDFGMSSKAIWKVWGIFPYIAEYRATINVDMLNYTGVEVNATMITKEGDSDEEAKDDLDAAIKETKDIAEEIKGLLDEAKEAMGGEEEEEEPASSKLAQRYSDMVQEESDWLKIVDKEIFSKEKQLPPALPIIAVEVKMDFVVQLDACVSVGFDMEYMTGKRYTYAVDVFAGSVKNDVIILQEEQFEFSFYAMGRLAIKVGVEFEFNIGLFTTDLASVGFGVGAGAYAKMWGYFYYELKYRESTGWNQKYSGALLIEVGAYLEINLKAQAIGGLLCKEYKVLDKEWPLWSVGRADSIQDFTTDQEDMPEIEMQQYIRTRYLPDSVFDMTYLDLKEGDVENKVYEDYFDSSKKVTEENRDNFDIRFTNDKFAYDPQTNAVTVNPSSSDKILEGEMIITWINYPMAFSSKPIQRTISLYWSNVRDGYVIVPYTNGGSYVDVINCKYNAAVSVPKDPAKAGYVFDGWYVDQELTKPYTFPELMPAEDVSIYAKWEPAADTAYTVEHYQEQLQSGEYELVETERFTGTTDTVATPDVKNYVGYVTPAKQEVQIKADGSAVLRYYYALDWHTVTFDPGTVGGDPVSYDLKYGGKISAPIMAAKGYIFTGWDKTVAANMGTEDVVYTAQWETDPNTPYRVEYYVQQTDGRYTMQYAVNGAANTGTTFTAQQLRELAPDGQQNADQLLLVDGGIVFESMTVNGTVCDSAAVEASGNTVIKLNYKREEHTLTLDHGYDNAVVESNLYYGQDILLPQSISRTGYTFVGWTLDGQNLVTTGIMPAADVTYTAVWAPNTYTVHFDTGDKTSTDTMLSQSFTYDQPQALTANTFTHPTYDVVGWTTIQGGGLAFTDGQEVSNLMEDPDGQIILYAVWTPHPFAITYENCEDSQNGNPGSYTVESDTITLAAAMRTGYIFAGWTDAEGNPVTQIKRGTSGDLVFTANWAPRDDTKYTVLHYVENVDGGYSLKEAEVLTGTTDAQVIPETKTYLGFDTPENQTLTITADGQAVLEYRYSRSSYTITLNADGGSVSTASITDKYGFPVMLPTPTRAGYGFMGWYTGDGAAYTLATMPLDGAELTAKWVAGQYGYTVNHYLQNLGGEGYTLVDSSSGTANIDAKVTPEMNSYTGFTAPEKSQTITIGVDASINVANYYYTRNKYEVTWDANNGSEDHVTGGMVYYGADLVAPVLRKTGYTYTWDQTPVTTMPAEDLTYTALWTPCSYDVVFNSDGGTVENGSLESRSVTYDAGYGELPVLTKKGYEFKGWYTTPDFSTDMITAQTPVKTASSHMLYAKFEPVQYAITYNGLEGGTNAANPTTYTIEQAITLAAPARQNYTFDGWYTDEALTQPVSVITKGSTGEMTFYAKWKNSAYSVVFHSNDGKDTTISQGFSTNTVQALTANSFTNTWYDFAGWSTTESGAVEYTDQQEVTNLATAGEKHLYAVWTPHTYVITYENIEGVENTESNPTGFSINSSSISLVDPGTRTGYTFGGWYVDPALTKEASGDMILAGAYDWIIYAKWTPNPYTITFDSCLGREVPTQTQMMEYGTAQNLTLLSELSDFTKPGYSFKGWSTTEGGSVEYSDGALTENLAASGNVNLYAVWSLDEYTITYDLGAGGISHENPASYTYEDGDVTISAPVAKDGYQFMGWYTENGTRVTEIVKGTRQNYSLTAKWAHGGIFTLSYTGYTSAEYGYDLTYTITRTVPAGTVVSTAPQHVYYRTLNGTAYGGTTSYSEENDICHFRHVGGPDVYATFEASDMSQSFTVQDWGACAAADGAASFSLNGTSRYFFVELYDVVDTTGTCQGNLGDAIKVKRIISPSSYDVSDSLYTTFVYRTLCEGEKTVTDSGYTDNTSYSFSPSQIDAKRGVDAIEILYRKQTGSGYAVYIDFDVKEEDDGYQWAAICTGSSYNTSKLLAEYHFATKDGEEASNWGRNVTLPNGGASAQGDILFSGGDCVVTENWAITTHRNHKCGIVGMNDTVSIHFDASGKNDDDWNYRNLKAQVALYDNDNPDERYVSPMALGNYKAGDVVNVTVVFDEVIASVSNVSLNAFSALPISSYTYVDGVGTNALTFQGALTSDFEVTTATNNTLYTYVPTVSGTITDYYGNS